jgi:hypothetical protein
MGEELDPIMAAFLKSMQRSSDYILGSLGIRVDLGEISEYKRYARLRDRLGRMTRFRRWLSWQLRDELLYREAMAHQAVFHAILEKGQEVLHA